MMHFTPMILAGGLGTRLRPVIPDLPKALSPVNGRPFIAYLLDQITDTGVQEVILCTGHRGDLIRRALGNTYKGLSIQYSHEPVPLGTGGALRHALDMVRSEFVLAMNGDSYCDVDLKSYVDWYFNKKYNASLVLTNVEDTSRYGSVKVDRDGRVLRFEEKSVNAGQGWINSGIYMLKKSLLASIPAGIKFSLELEFFPQLAEKGLYGFHVYGKFIDIGTPESYLFAEKFFGGKCK